MDADSVSTTTRCGICNLPSGSTIVTDADEEVFLLYTALASKNTNHDDQSTFRGLGFLDSHKDTLTLEFTAPHPHIAKVGDVQSSRTKRGKARAKSAKTEERTIEIVLAQDKTALRSRKGDTGSVLWQASVEFAQFFLKQTGQPSGSFMNTQQLANAHILELGAGTGLLSIVLSPLISQYTVTDIQDLIPLISKNLTLNNIPHTPGLPSIRSSISSPKVTVEALDWIVLQTCTPSARKAAFSYPPIDLLLIVDCIYHPSLLPALVATIDHLATPEKTAVLVVVELRAEDVVREFLELWLAVGDGGSWEIWHVEGLMEGPYAMWVGWKRSGS